MERRAADRAIGAVVVLIVLLAALHAVRRWRGGDRFTLGRAEAVRSGLDGQRYRVHLGHADAGGAADTMAELNRRATALMRRLRARYLRGGAAASPGRAEAARRLLKLYNPDNLAENSPRDPGGDTSYTIDKGAVLALCLRRKGAGGGPPGAGHGLHDMETLTFVTLHELTHIAIRDVDHPKAFWVAFKFILEEARAARILRGVDYGRRPAVYCGMDIDYSPLFDRDVAALE